MKATELMIGDIVLHHKTHELLSIDKLKKSIDEYIRIESIIKEGVNEAYCQGYIDWIGYGEIEPIPLTAKILEINGFKWSETLRVWCIFGKGNKHLTMTYDGEMFCIHGTCIKFQYIHELQHALRLCGLTDLADNFKIETDK